MLHAIDADNTQNKILNNTWVWREIWNEIKHIARERRISRFIENHFFLLFTCVRIDLWKKKIGEIKRGTETSALAAAPFIFLFAIQRETRFHAHHTHSCEMRFWQCAACIGTMRVRSARDNCGRREIPFKIIFFQKKWNTKPKILPLKKFGVETKWNVRHAVQSDFISHIPFFLCRSKALGANTWICCRLRLPNTYTIRCLRLNVHRIFRITRTTIYYSMASVYRWTEMRPLFEIRISEKINEGSEKTVSDKKGITSTKKKPQIRVIDTRAKFDLLWSHAICCVHKVTDAFKWKRSLNTSSYCEKILFCTWHCVYKFRFCDENKRIAKKRKNCMKNTSIVVLMKTTLIAARQCSP